MRTALSIAIALTVPLLAQEPVTAVVERAAAYVEQYQSSLSLIVSEERYDQEARYPAQNARSRDVSIRTVLRSDFLLVRNPAGGWLPFRDVFERDGARLRDRDERLAQLFLTDNAGALDQARRIMDEGARYNVGNVSRNVNLPTLALLFLTSELRAGFAFEDAGSEGAVRVIRYREDRRPTYMSTTGGRSLPVSGRYWVDASTGRVERTELLATDADVDARIEVTYRPDETAGLWVPSRMEERYRLKGDGSEVIGIATYSRFRRFKVDTTENLAR